MRAERFLANHFLIAMPRLADPNFFHSVALICEHNEDGALGIVINRPSEMQLVEIFEHMEMHDCDPAMGARPVLSGGPVQPERGFVLHEPLGDWEATLKVSNDIGITASQDILASLSRGDGPQRSLVALGYAGWAAGQLEQEIADNAWLSGPANSGILFDLPYDQRWAAAAAELGIDLNLLPDDAGHA